MPDLTQNEQLHGSFLIVPLKYDSESLNRTYLEEIGCLINQMMPL